jgi:hypothetical protein
MGPFTTNPAGWTLFDLGAAPPHFGPNTFQNYPVLTSATSSAVGTTVSGTLNGQAKTTFRIEFFSNTVPDATGYGQGQTYLGFTNVPTDNTGNVTFTFPLAAANLGGQWITATATDPNGNTSEFSAAVPILGPNQTFAQFLQAALPQSSTAANLLTIVTGASTLPATVIQAVNGLTNVTQPVTIILDLGGGTYSSGGFSANPPTNVTFVVQNGTLDPSYPALTVAGGLVSVLHCTLTTTGDAPTILVTGGSLTLRNDIIQESTGFTDAAISITGGTLDLGTTASPGNNTINVNGTGQFVQNSTSNSIPAVGDTFESNGTALPAPLLSLTSLTASVNPSTLNQSVTLTASVRPNGSATTPTGSVDFFDTTTNTDLGSVSLSGGSASLTKSALAVGNHVIRASYIGNSVYLPSLAVLTQQVHYTFSGFLPPLNQGLAFGIGRTVPIKFQLTDYNKSYISSLSAVTALQVVYPDGSTHAISGLRYDSTANQFIANWQTKGLSAGNYTVSLTLADGTSYAIAVSLSKTGASADLTTVAAGGTGSAPGGLLGGNIELYVDNSNGDLTADELARIQDAVTAVDTVTVPNGVTVTEITDPSQADVTLNMDATSAVGSYSTGVLGCTTDAGQITIIAGWNFYAGASATQIGSAQFDFETVVAHELGHALGLGHSTNAASVMYATLTTGTTNRALAVADLNVPDSDTGGACGLHAEANSKNQEPSSKNEEPISKNQIPTAPNLEFGSWFFEFGILAAAPAGYQTQLDSPTAHQTALNAVLVDWPSAADSAGQVARILDDKEAMGAASHSQARLAGPAENDDFGSAIGLTPSWIQIIN